MPSLKLNPRFLLLFAAASIAACQPDGGEETPVNEMNETASVPVLPLPDPPMDRAGLLQAVARAASAVALGQSDRDQQRSLDGRRFEVRIRFGCASTPAKAAGGPFSVRFDEEDRVLRIRAAPDLTLEEPWIATRAGETVEAVEGFWMRRPWLLSDGCPARPAPLTNQGNEEQPSAEPPEQKEPAEEEDGPPPIQQRVGLAQFFTEADPRTGRRDGRAFEATKVLAADEQPSAEGYNLVLSGRLKRLPDGNVVACHLVTPDLPPECVVSAEFDQVWVERPGSKARIAEWTR